MYGLGYLYSTMHAYMIGHIANVCLCLNTIALFAQGKHPRNNIDRRGQNLKFQNLDQVQKSKKSKKLKSQVLQVIFLF